MAPCIISLCTVHARMQVCMCRNVYNHNLAALLLINDMIRVHCCVRYDDNGDYLAETQRSLH